MHLPLTVVCPAGSSGDIRWVDTFRGCSEVASLFCLQTVSFRRSVMFLFFSVLFFSLLNRFHALWGIEFLLAHVPCLPVVRSKRTIVNFWSRPPHLVFPLLSSGHGSYLPTARRLREAWLVAVSDTAFCGRRHLVPSGVCTEGMEARPPRSNSSHRRQGQQ